MLKDSRSSTFQCLHAPAWSSSSEGGGVCGCSRLSRSARSADFILLSSITCSTCVTDTCDKEHDMSVGLTTTMYHLDGCPVNAHQHAAKGDSSAHTAISDYMLLYWTTSYTCYMYVITHTCLRVLRNVRHCSRQYRPTPADAARNSVAASPGMTRAVSNSGCGPATAAVAR